MMMFNCGCGEAIEGYSDWLELVELFHHERIGQ